MMFRTAKAASLLLAALLLATVAGSQEPGRVRLDPHVLLATREEIIARIPERRPPATRAPRRGGTAVAGRQAVESERRAVEAALARERRVAQIRLLRLRRKALTIAQGGYEQLRADKSKAAESLFRQSLKTYFRTALAHAGLGAVFQDRGDLVNAEKECRLALAQSPRLAMGYCFLGAVLYDRKLYPKAKDALTRANEINPKLPIVHAYLGATYYELGQPEEARRECRTTLNLNPPSAIGREALALAHTYLGAIAYDRREPGEAKASFAQALELDPDLVLAHVYLGAVLYEMGEYDEAERVLTTAVRLDQKFALAHKLLGDVYYVQGEFDKAQQALTLATSLDAGSALARADLAAVYVRQALEDDTNREDHLAKAEDRCRQAIRLAPWLDIPHNYLGQVHFWRGENAAAEQAFKEAIRLDQMAAPEDYADPHCKLGDVYYRLRRYEDALKAYEACERLDPNHPEVKQKKQNAQQHLRRSGSP
jgi:tetratricopeptide (TPR) repeat protein